MTIPKPSVFIKPTLETKFHIDYGWWERSAEDLHTYLMSHLTPEQREAFQQTESDGLIDHIDPDTGEVKRMDALRLALQRAAAEPDFINQHSSLVDSVFRVFLRNDNTPQTPGDLSRATGRDAETILKTLSGRRTYKGIKPA